VPPVIVLGSDVGRSCMQRAEDEDDVSWAYPPGMSLDQIEVDGCLLDHGISMPNTWAA
jgi:hypothetical protein